MSIIGSNWFTLLVTSRIIEQFLKIQISQWYIVQIIRTLDHQILALYCLEVYYWSTLRWNVAIQVGYRSHIEGDRWSLSSN